METIFEIFAMLNNAIESGTMTQAAMAAAILSIAQRLHVEWEAGKLSPPLLLKADEELRSLNRHWKEHQQISGSGKLSRSQPCLSLVSKERWSVTAQRVIDYASGLTFLFTYNEGGECRLLVSGPNMFRAIDFGHDGCVQLSDVESGRLIR